MKALVLLIACFALANADDTVKDDVKTWIKDYKNSVNAIGKGAESGGDVAKLVREHLNPVTMAELEVFGLICQPADQASSSSSSSSSSEQKKDNRPKRDAKTSQIEKACVALFKEWPQAQEKSDALSAAAKTAWNQYMDEEIGNEYYLLQLEILVRWDIYMSDAKCGCDKFKVKLPKLKLKLAKRWKKFVKKMKIRFEKIGGAISLKWNKLSASLDANWAKFKLSASADWAQFKINADICWSQFKADWADFKIQFNARLDAFKLSAKARWDKIKAAFKEAGKEIKKGAKHGWNKFTGGVKDVGKGIAKGASKTADFFVDGAKKVKGMFSHSSSSSSSSSSESCELETYIRNNKNARAKIHAQFNANKSVA